MKKHRKTIIITSIVTLMPIIAGLLLWDRMLDMVFWIIPLTSLVACLSTYGIAAGYDINIGFVMNLLVGVIFINSERTPLPLNHLTRLTESEGGGMNLMCFFKENINPLNACKPLI